MSRLSALKMIKRRVRKVRLPAEICAHSFRGTGITEYLQNANGGAKVDHGSGGTVPLRRSETLPVWEPFPVTGRVGGFIPWSCIARSVWRAGTG